jgi:uncharacterized protein (TIGR02588 family)
VRSRHWIEWLVLACSVGVVAALFVLLVYDGLTRMGDPRLRVVLSAPVRQDSAWVVPLSLRNDGSAAAAGVDVEVTLSTGGGQTSSTVTIAFAPGGSEVEAGVLFDENPSLGRLEPRVLGYELP